MWVVLFLRPEGTISIVRTGTPLRHEHHFQCGIVFDFPHVVLSPFLEDVHFSQGIITEFFRDSRAVIPNTILAICSRLISSVVSTIVHSGTDSGMVVCQIFPSTYGESRQTSDIHQTR